MKVDTLTNGGTVREQIANALRKKIIYQEILPGEKLSERVIGDMFQVSAMPVKEAFTMLATEGLVEIVPRSGTFVSKLAIDRLEQLSYFRSSLEGVATYFTTLKITDEKIEQLDKLLKQAWLLLNDHKFGEFTSTNHLFHDKVIQFCENPYIINIIKTTRKIDSSIDQDLKTEFFHSSYEKGMLSYSYHYQIFEAIKDGNANLAEQLMTQHVRFSINYKLPKTK